MDEKPKIKPEQLGFVGFGSRYPNFNIIRWLDDNGGKVVVNCSDPLILNDRGYPVRIGYTPEQIHQVHNKLVELGL